MQRRQFITLLGGAAACKPMSAGGSRTLEPQLHVLNAHAAPFVLSAMFAPQPLSLLLLLRLPSISQTSLILCPQSDFSFPSLQCFAMKKL